MRDAEAANPGVIRRTLDARLAQGKEPAKSAMAAGAAFPSLVVFQEGDRFWLAEGFRRLPAGLPADLAVRGAPGDLSDAILHSVRSNATHGLRRTDADKRRAVSILLRDELVAVDPATGDPWSDREVARQCSVSHMFVSRIREDRIGNVASDPATRAYRGRHGNVTQMDTARIGRRTAEPATPR